MQKPTDGAQRPSDRLRTDRTRASSASRINGRSISAARAARSWFRSSPIAAHRPLRATLAAALRPLLTAERALPVAVAAIVAVASLLALLPSTPQGAVGGTTGSGSPVRIAIGGGFESQDLQTLDANFGGAQGDVSFQPVTIPGDVITQPVAETAQVDAGALLEDGTLLTGYAPTTTVEDGSDLIQTYKVKSGDALVEIAHRFGVSMMTLWWANKLSSKDELHVGQILRIPPVSGLVVTVRDGDTLDSLAAKYRVDASRIIELNGLEDPTLVIGQVLVLPGAKGEPIPTPKPTPKPAPRAAHSTSRSGGGGGGTHYSGGTMHWPVVGGNNYISQYFHYGHYAIDIAADYGSRVVAAAGGRVTFAGWKSNGGGYQVWISHGGGIYTTYNHMSAITVGDGQYVSRGQQVGRVGQSGNATGPHLHFEVWIGPIWNGGTRVNPLRYL